MTAPQTPSRTSEILRQIATKGSCQTVLVRDIVRTLSRRALGFTLFLFAVPATLPMPPGIPALCGILIAFIAGHLVLGLDTLWLPRALADRPIERKTLKHLADRAIPALERIERFARPRLAFLTGDLFRRLIGLTVFVLGVILLLPFPFLGNAPPGLAATVIAIGLTQRDGIIVLMGMVLAGIAIAISAALTYTVVELFERLF